MKFNFASLALLLMVAPLRVRAQTPELDLRSAVNALEQAGNYSWEEKRMFDFSSRGIPKNRVPKFATGQTRVGSLTLATVQRRPVALLEGKMAYLLSRGWCHSNDLTESDLIELGYPSISSRPNPFLADFTVPLPHEVLEVLLKKGRNFQKVGSSWVGELPSSPWEMMELEMYLEGHANVFPSNRSRPPSNLTREYPNQSVSFSVWFENDVITEVSVEIKKSALAAAELRVPNPRPSTKEFDFKLSDVGRTVFDVPPEAQAVLSVR